MLFLSRFIVRFHKTILILSLLASAGAVFLITRLHLDLNLLALIPKDNPSARAFFDVAESIGFQSNLIAVVEMPSGLDRDRAERFVDRLAEALAACPSISGLEYRSGTVAIGSLLEQFLPFFPAFLSPTELPSLAQRLSDEGIERQVRENKKVLMTPFGLGAKDLVFADPLGLRDLLLSRMGRDPLGKARGSEPGLYRTPDGGTYFLFLKPARPPQDMSFSRDLMARLSRIADDVVAATPAEDKPVTGEIRVRYAGGHAIAVKDEAMTRKDIRLTILTSFFGVMLLFGLSFRTLRILLYVSPPLMAGLIWTLGFGKLVFGSLNVLTCVFSCVLIGLGIDYAIHIVNGYFGDSAEALTLEDRLEKTLRETGTGIIIGATTTAAAFYSIALSDFGGFRQLGLLTGTGILFCLLAMLLVLPSLLTAIAGKSGRKRKIMVVGFGLRPLVARIMGWPRTVLISSGVLVLVLAAIGTRIDFDDNLRNFRPADDESFRLQEKISEWLGGSTAEVILVVKGNSESDAMESSASVLQAIKELEAADAVASVRSLSRYFPPPSVQTQNLAYLREHSDLFEMERIRRSFQKALLSHGFQDSDLYGPYLAALSRALSLEQIVLPSRFKGSPFEPLLKPFTYESGSSSYAVTYITPRSDLWSRSDVIPFRDMIVRKLDQVGIRQDAYALTGAALLTADLKSLLIKNVRGSLLLAGLSILVMLSLYYKKPASVLLSCLPLIAALLTLAGLMVLLHLRLDFFNLIVLPMIIGIGIDDGVHLTNTYRREPPEVLPEALAATGRAVVLTSLTTVVGFGSIALAHYPGLKSMGYVAVIGIAACLFTSLLFLPALFALLRRWSRWF